MRNKQIDTQDISKKLFRKWKYYGHKMLPICWLYTQYSSWNDIISAMSKIPQCIVKPQKQSVFPMFWVPLHRLVISRAGDRTLVSKNCAINSSIYPMLLCTHRVDITCLQWGIRWNILTTCGGYTAREWLLQAFTVQQWGPSKLWGRSTLSACWGEAAKVAGIHNLLIPKGEKADAFSLVFTCFN